MTTPGEFALAEPYWLCLLAVIPFLYWARRRAAPSKEISSLSPFDSVPTSSWRTRLEPAADVLRAAWLVCLILALAQPSFLRSPMESAPDLTVMPPPGEAIVIVLDQSGSMAAPLLIPLVDKSPADGPEGKPSKSRLAAAIDWLEHGIPTAPENTRFALIRFAREAKVLAPLTQRRDLVLDQLKSLTIDRRDNRTNVGTALLMAVDHVLKDRGLPEHSLSVAERKDGRVLLITDGAQTVPGAPSIEEGLRVAEALGVRVDVLSLADLDPQAAEDRRRLRLAEEWTGGHWHEIEDPVTPFPSDAVQETIAADPGATDPLSDLSQPMPSLVAYLLGLAAGLALIECIIRSIWLPWKPQPVG